MTSKVQWLLQTEVKLELCPPAQNQYQIQQQQVHLKLHINIFGSVDFDLTLYQAYLNEIN